MSFQAGPSCFCCCGSFCSSSVSWLFCPWGMGIQPCGLFTRSRFFGTQKTLAVCLYFLLVCAFYGFLVFINKCVALKTVFCCWRESAFRNFVAFGFPLRCLHDILTFSFCQYMCTFYEICGRITLWSKTSNLHGALNTHLFVWFVSGRQSWLVSSSITVKYLQQNLFSCKKEESS